MNTIPSMQLESWARSVAAGETVGGLTYAEMIEAMRSGRFALYLARELLDRGEIDRAREAINEAIAAIEGHPTTRKADKPTE